MKLVNRVWRWISSPRLAQVAMLSWLGLLLLALLPLQLLGLPGDQTRSLVYRSVPFVIVYAVLLSGGLVLVWRRMRTLPKKMAPIPAIERLARGRRTAVPDFFDPLRARRALRSAGYRSIGVSAEYAWGLRFPWSPVGTVILHASFILVAVGALATLVPGASFSGRARVTQGDSLSGTTSQYFENGLNSAPAILGVGPTFKVAEVSGSAIDGLAPQRLSVTLSDSRDRRRVLSAGSAWVPDPFTAVSVEDFDLTPTISVVPSGAVEPIAVRPIPLVSSRSGVPQNAEVRSPSGKRYRLGLRVSAGAESVPARDPVLLLSVSEAQGNGTWKRLDAPQRLSVGSSRKFGSITARLDSVRPNAVIRVTRSASTPLIALGVLGVAIGAAVRLTFPRSEALIAAAESGVTLSVAVDAYREAASATRDLVRAWEASR